jgi:hypothetical protein
MRTVFIEGDPERRKGGAEKAAKQADASFGSLTKAIESLVASTI